MEKTTLAYIDLLQKESAKWITLFEWQRAFCTREQLSSDGLCCILGLPTSCSQYIHGDVPDMIPSSKPESLGNALRTKLTEFMNQNVKLSDIKLSDDQIAMLWYYRHRQTLVQHGIEGMRIINNPDGSKEVRFTTLLKTTVTIPELEEEFPFDWPCSVWCRVFL